MTVAVFTEPLHPSSIIVSEGHGDVSRDALVVAQNQNIVSGQVLGRTTNLTGLVAPTTQIVALAGANGAITMDGTAPIRADAIDGVYMVEINTAGATAEFALMDPNGIVVGEGNVGTLFNGQLKFTIANGSPSYGVGDRILINVAIPIPQQQWEALNLAATDGSQITRAIALQPATTGAGATQTIVGLTRLAEVRASDLTWPSGATTAQIAEGLNQLAKIGILAR